MINQGESGESVSEWMDLKQQFECLIRTAIEQKEKQDMHGTSREFHELFRKMVIQGLQGDWMISPNLYMKTLIDLNEEEKIKSIDLKSGLD